MTFRPYRRTLPVAAALALLAGCTSAPDPTPRPAPVVPAGALRLVAFDSCDDLLKDLRKAVSKSVGPYGIDDHVGRMPSLATGARRAAAEDAAGAGAPAPAVPRHSTTNTHEAGADEPDLVKTDGRRIVTVTGGVLRVVDAASRRLTGQVALGVGADGWQDAGLLLAGDRALVLLPGPAHPMADIALPGRPAPQPADGIEGPRLLMVDLAGTPRVTATFRTDGELVDARQVGTTARVVVRTAPRLVFPMPADGTDAQRTAANRKVVDKAPAEAWLPRFEVTAGGRTERGRVGCDRVSRPPTYSGTSMVTVLSFDLTTGDFGDGDPVSVVADGDTVYSNGPSLYLASRNWPSMQRLADRRPVVPTTQIYRFDTSGAGRPVYAAAGSVPGRLINQYALSEWQGHLRVATTVDGDMRWPEPIVEGAPARSEAPRQSESAVYVLRQQGAALTETGRVGGLGKGEQIYAVRFLGGTGHVVTFRQTDPLYTLDLTDPAKPVTTGELKITGYSAYLHPLDGGRLLGIGQEASTEGRRLGTQVSLFDVGDPRRPDRLAQHHVADGSSEAEFDPHAFLYWPARGLLVVPLTVYNERSATPGQPASTALVLRVGDRSLTEAGKLQHPGGGTDDTTIRRSLVVGDVLWTVSGAGLLATDMSTMDRLGWLPTT